MKQEQMLIDCVLALKEVRAELHNDVDPSVITELDRVIQKFEFCLQQGLKDVSAIRAARNEGLKTVALVIESLVGIADLIVRLCQ